MKKIYTLVVLIALVLVIVSCKTEENKIDTNVEKDLLINENKEDNNKLDSNINNNDNTDKNDNTDNKDNADKKDNIDNKDNENKYRDALSETDLKNIEKIVNDYYNKTVWNVISFTVTDDDNLIYNNYGNESNYKVGEIIIFDVIAEKGGEIFDNKRISVAKVNEDTWEVINEGKY